MTQPAENETESKFAAKDERDQESIDDKLASRDDNAGYNDIARQVTSDDTGVDITAGLSEKLSAATNPDTQRTIDETVREELSQRVADASTGGTGDSFDLPFTGRALTDRSIEYRTAEMRDAASLLGIDGASMAAGSAPTYDATSSTAAIEQARAVIEDLNSRVKELYAGTDQQWVKDMGMAQTPLMQDMDTVAGDSELGELSSAMTMLTSSVNTSVSSLNTAGATYTAQAADAYNKVHGFMGWFRRPVLTADPSFSVAVSNPVMRAGEAAKLVAGVGTSFTAPAGASGAGATLPGGTNPSGNTPLQPGGTTPGSAPRSRGGAASGGSTSSASAARLASRIGESSSQSSSKKIDKEKLVDDATKRVIEAMRERSGEGKTGPANAVDQTVNDAAKALTSGGELTAAQIDQLLAAGVITSEQAQALAAQATRGASMTTPTALDTYLSSARGDAGGANPDLAAARAGMDSSRPGVSPSALSAEARAADAALSPAAFAAAPGDPVPRRGALDANMRPLDTGTGRVDANALPATKSNMTNPDGSARVVPTSIEVDGEEYTVPAVDPRLMEMMHIVADAADGEDVPVLEAARRAGVPLESYGDRLTDPLQARAGDVVVGSRGNGFYMGEGNVLMESGEVKPLGEVLELRPPNAGIFRLALPELPDATRGGDAAGEAGGGDANTPAPEPTPAPPAAGGSFDPFAEGGITPPAGDNASTGGGGVDTTLPPSAPVPAPAPASAPAPAPEPAPAPAPDNAPEPAPAPDNANADTPDTGERGGNPVRGRNPDDPTTVGMREVAYEGRALG